MKTKLNKLLALVMCLVMFISCTPLDALAAIVPVNGGTTYSKGFTPSSIMPTSVDPVVEDDVYVTFLFKNGETTVSTQIVRKPGEGETGETVVQPSTPEVAAGQKFLGWYVGDTAFVFGVQDLSGYTKSATVEVAAKFSAVYYAYFMTIDGTVYRTLEATGENNFTVTAPNDYEPAGKRVTAWKNGETVAPGASVKLSADTAFTPQTVDCVRVTYETNGVGHVVSDYADIGGTVTLSTVQPARTGYTFGGWSLTEGGTTAVTEIKNIQEDTTVYAIWAPADVTYTVVYWGENADDTDYSALATASKTARTGTELTLDATSGALPSSYTDRGYFTFEKSDTVTILANGSSVLNVYFTRNVYTITFDLLGNLRRSSLTQSPVLTKNGQTYTDTYSFKAKYEQDISAQWPTAEDFTTLPVRSSFGPGSGTTTYYFSRWADTWVSKRLTLTSNIISNGTISANWDTNLVTYTLNYMFETPDGSGTAYSYGGTTRYYKKSEAYSQTVSTTRASSWNAKLITGFTSVNVVPDSKTNTFTLYYSRNKYKLTLNNYGTTTSQNEVMFEASLASYGTPPNRPSDFSEKAVFKGWYTVAPEHVTEDTKAFDFATSTMPASDLVLHACWEEPKITVTLTVEVEIEGGGTLELTIPSGSSISEVTKYNDFKDKIKAAGKILLKWVDVSTGETFNENERIYADKKLKGILKGDTFKVTYDLGDGAGTAPKDSRAYEFDTKAKALAFPADAQAPEGKVFAYWTVTDASTGTVVKYYPGQNVPVKGDVILVANYADKTGTVDVTYHANFGEDKTKKLDEGTPVNGMITVASYGETALPARTGYTFSGWATSKDGAVAFKAGASARITAGDDNHLYAIWTANTDTRYTVEFYYQNTDGRYALKSSDERKGTTDTTVSVTEDDKAAKEGNKYVFDADNESNVLSGTVAGAGTLVLKLYFKLNTAGYTIHHYLKGPTVKVADDQTGTMTIGETLTANRSEALYTEYAAASVSDYSPKQTIEIVADEKDNVITVYYTMPLTITAASAEKTYDGQPLTQPDFTVTGLVNGDTKEYFTLSMTADSTITDAGTTDNVIDTTTVKYREGAIPSYYIVSYKKGTLKIDPVSAEVTVTENSATVTYNGEEHSVKGYKTMTADNELYDVKTSVKETETADWTATGKNVGTYPVGIVAGDFENTNKNFTNVTFKIVDGSLVIEKAAIKEYVTLKPTDVVKTYDGTTYTAGVATAADKNGNTLKIEYSVDGENWTTKPEEITAKDVADSKTVKVRVSAENYEGYVEGEEALTINRRPVKLVASSAEKDYDRRELTRPEYTVNLNGTELGTVASGESLTLPYSGDTVKATVEGTITYVGEIPNEITDWSVQNASGKDMSANYNIEPVDGTLTIHQVYTKLNATKEWVRPKIVEELGEGYPEITVIVYQDGAEYGRLTITAEDGWKASMTGLPVAHGKDDDPGEYVYTAEEVLPAGYSKTEGFEPEKLETLDEHYEYIVTNEMETTTFSGTKTWEMLDTGWDGTTETPDVTIHLLRNGENYRDYVIASGEEAYEFNDLPTYDPNGEAYVYEAEEEVPAGYESTKTETEKSANFTNTQVGYSYTVKYYRQMLEDNELSDKYELVEDETETYEHIGYGWTLIYDKKDFEGFYYEKTMKTLTEGGEEIEFVEGDTMPDNNELEIHVYYVRRTDLTYTIEYRLNNAKGRILSETKVVENCVYGKTYLETPVDLLPEYICDEKEFEMLVTDVDTLNYHVFIYAQRRIYTVEYYYEGVLDTTKTEYYWARIGTVITNYTPKSEGGYRLDHVENCPLMVVIDGTLNVIRVYYTKTPEIIIPDVPLGSGPISLNVGDCFE